MKRSYLYAAVFALAFLGGCSTDPKVQSQRYTDNANRYFDRKKYKEASIMYRRALQKDAKNTQAWYKLGMLNMQTGGLLEARADFVRVTDLAETEPKVNISRTDLEHAYAEAADLDYIACLAGRERHHDTREFENDLAMRAKKLSQQFANTFDAYRVAGLWEWVQAISIQTPNQNDQRDKHIAAALSEFQQADKLKPYSRELGYALINTLAATKQQAEAERYAGELLARRVDDPRIYEWLWKVYMASNRPDQAEQVRKKQTEANPTNAKAWVELAAHYLITNNPGARDAALDKLKDTKTFPEGYLDRGDFYEAIAKFPEAITEWQQGIKVDASNKALYQKKIAEAYLRSAKPDEAGKLLAEVLKDNPNDAEAIAMRASLTLDHAKPADADKIIAELQPLLAKTSPDKPQQLVILRYDLGRAYGLKGDPQSLDQARLQLQEAIKVPRQYPYLPAYLALAYLELTRGENSAAIEHAKVILTTDRAIDGFTKQAALIRTTGLARLGQVDDARKGLDAILKVAPSTPAAQYQLAELEMSQKHYAEAEKDFERLRTVNDPRGLPGVVRAKVAQGRISDAIQILQAEIVKSPNDVILRSNLAALRFDAGQFAEAATEFKTLFDQNPNADIRLRENWLIRRGEALRRNGDTNGAMSAFMRASEIAPADTTPRLEAAILLDMQGNADEARKGYREVLHAQPENFVALNNLAYLNAASGTDLDQALGYAQRAQKQRPDDLNVRDTIGLIYYQKNLVDESSRMFSDLVNRSPDNATYHLHLAMALLKKGDKPQARHELDMARRNRPSDREQVQIKDLMSKIG